MKSEQNKKLIAELLDALQMLLNEINKEGVSYRQVSSDMRQQVRAVIAKAKAAK